jgi:hypothetical protein
VSSAIGTLATPSMNTVTLYLPKSSIHYSRIDLSEGIKMSQKFSAFRCSQTTRTGKRLIRSGSNSNGMKSLVKPCLQNSEESGICRDLCESTLMEFAATRALTMCHCCSLLNVAGGAVVLSPNTLFLAICLPMRLNVQDNCLTYWSRESQLRYFVVRIHPLQVRLKVVPIVSIRWVWAPVSGLTKCGVWRTVN